METVKRGKRSQISKWEEISTDYTLPLKNELGEVAVFSGKTGEFIRYQKPLSDNVTCYFEYSKEDIDMDTPIGFWNIDKEKQIKD